MAGVNKVILVGRLGKDPEIRTTQNGTPVASFSLATSDNWTKDGQREERTEWHNVVLWSRLAELAGKYLSKGRQVYIEGRIQTRSWDDKEGQKRYTTEIVGQQLQFLGGNNEQPGQPGQPGQNNNAPTYTNNTPAPALNVDHGANSFASDDDIPF